MGIDILLEKLAKPAQRALHNAGITTIKQLSNYSEEEVSKLHGIGKSAMNTIKLILNENGLIFSTKDEKKTS
jgi:DNA-directed RNA polymerase alpha subunit